MIHLMLLLLSPWQACITAPPITAIAADLTTGGRVAIYAQPSASAEIIGWAENGDCYATDDPVQMSTDQWYRVHIPRTLDGQLVAGYIDGRHIDLHPGGERPAPIRPTCRVYTLGPYTVTVEDATGSPPPPSIRLTDLNAAGDAFRWLDFGTGVACD